MVGVLFFIRGRRDSSMTQAEIDKYFSYGVNRMMGNYVTITDTKTHNDDPKMLNLRGFQSLMSTYGVKKK